MNGVERMWTEYQSEWPVQKMYVEVGLVMNEWRSDYKTKIWRVNGSRRMGRLRKSSQKDRCEKLKE